MDSVQPHVIFVCTSCGRNRASVPTVATDITGIPAGVEAACPSQGDRLLQQLQSRLESDQRSCLKSSTPPLATTVSIQPVQCMGLCEQDCVVAFVAPGKRTYVFGNLPTDEAHLEDTAAAVLTCARQYQSKTDGALSYFERPELLKTRVLARIPPLPAQVMA
jgi:predicted metal-binding protein